MRGQRPTLRSTPCSARCKAKVRGLGPALVGMDLWRTDHAPDDSVLAPEDEIRTTQALIRQVAAECERVERFGGQVPVIPHTSQSALAEDPISLLQWRQ